MEHLHKREAFKPLLLSEITPQEGQRAIESHTVLKEKSDGTIKGRTVADGRSQRAHIPKGAASSPTPHNDSLTMICGIAAQEERDVATTDIPNAFIQTKINTEGEKITMKLRGKLTKYLIRTDPQHYRKCAVYKGGKP